MNSYLRFFLLYGVLFAIFTFWPERTPEPVPIEAKMEQGIFREAVLCDRSEVNPYDLDNQIFKHGLAFHYDYDVLVEGDVFRFVKPPTDVQCLHIPDEMIVPKGKGETVEYFAFEPYQLPDSVYYNPRSCRPSTSRMLSVGLRDTLLKTRNGISIVENPQNVWMSNHWSYDFHLFNIAPNPFIQAPFEVGHHWQYSKEVEIISTFKQFEIPKGKYTVDCQYEIVGRQPMQTDLGTLDCYLIVGLAQSEYGVAKLRALFHESYGFVQLQYEFENGIKVDLNLREPILIASKEAID